MKILFTLCCVSIFCFKSYSQDYPIFTTFSLWQVVYQNGPLYPNSQQVYSIPKLQSDTVINSFSYKKMFYQYSLYSLGSGYDPISLPLYWGGVRNDSVAKKTYFIQTGDSVEYLIYDFNANAGDTLLNVFNLLEYDTCNYLVSSVDTLFLCGKEIRHFVLQRIYSTGNGVDIDWYEGWGGAHGILTTPTDANLFCCFTLICFSSNDTIYDALLCYAGQCQLPTNVVEISNPNESILISPNPATQNFIITSNHLIRNGEIQIFNIVGENVMSENIYSTDKKEFNIKNIPSGIYSVKIFDGENQYCKKLIIQQE